MVDRADTYSAGASREDFDMPSGYESLHGMIQCEHCGAMSQFKPEMEQTRCNGCGSDLRQ